MAGLTQVFKNGNAHLHFMDERDSSSMGSCGSHEWGQMEVGGLDLGLDLGLHLGLHFFGGFVSLHEV